MPDGRHVLVVGNRPGRPPGFWLLDAGGGPPRSVSPEGYYFSTRAGHRLSPDGRYVFCGSANVPMGLFDLQAQVMKPLPASMRDLRFVGFGPDAQSLIGYDREANPTTVYRVDLATGSRRALFQLPHAQWETVLSVRVSADLRSYAYTTASILNDLYLMRGLR